MRGTTYLVTYFCALVRLLPTAYVVRGKVMFWHAGFWPPWVPHRRTWTGGYPDWGRGVPHWVVLDITRLVWLLRSCRGTFLLFVYMLVATNPSSPLPNPQIWLDTFSDPKKLFFSFSSLHLTFHLFLTFHLTLYLAFHLIISLFISSSHFIHLKIIPGTNTMLDQHFCFVY